MTGMKFIATATLAISTQVCAADEQARAALEQAFDRQRALPGYVEHQFSRVLEPNGTSAPAMGPERETLTIEHSGERQRLLMRDAGEMVRANGRVAHRFNVSPQVAQIRAAATTTPMEGLETVSDVIGSLKSTYDFLSQGPVGVFLGAMTVFDQASQMLSRGGGQAALFQVADMLEQQSAWRCDPDVPGAQHSGKVIDSQQLADESIANVPVHVYSETREFDFAAPPRRIEASGAEAPPRGFRVQSRSWLRASDGLPLRSELMISGRGILRTEYEYPSAPVEFALPECVTRP